MEEESRLNLSPEYRDLVRYFRLSMLRDRKVLPPSGLKELEEIVARNERAQAIEFTRGKYTSGEIDEDDYRKVYDVHRAALAEAIKNAERIVVNNNKEQEKEFPHVSQAGWYDRYRHH